MGKSIKNRLSGISGRKAQFTIFIIIGMLILGTFLAAQYAVQQQQKANLEAQAQLIANEFKQTTAINYYVTLCLKKVTEEALQTAGNQGGIIYQISTGSQPIQSLTFARIPISYGILAREPSDFFKSVPEYPYIGKIIPSSIPYYGRVQLPALCDPNGPNKVGFSATLCPRYGFNSIQQQINEYVQNNLDRCVNLSSIKTIQNATAGKPNISITVDENDIQVEALYPINVRMGSYTPKVVMADFSTVLYIRLKKIYDIAYNAIRLDTTDANFNILKGPKNFTSWDSYINITKYCPYCNAAPASYDNIVSITDAASQISGRPYTFQFAVQKRNPVLDYIHYTASNDSDIVVLENQTISISPFGYDPDEQALTYQYSGWKEDYDESFDEACCLQKPNRCFQNITEIEQCTARNEAVQPKNWSNSNDFKLSQEKASYHTTRADIGYHNLTVTVYDSSGLKDWQIVRIVVMDIARANATGSSFMDDISASKASVEDPYILNASNTVSYFTSGLSYLWQDPQEGFSLETAKRELIIPENSNITNIIDGIFKRSLYRANETVHNITLTLLPQNSTSNFLVEVYPCLPHRNKDSFPYPYNSTDPYLSDHTCCDDNYNISSTDKTCFEQVEYGGLFDFDPASINGYPIPNDNHPIIYKDEKGNVLTNLIYFDLNDVYRRTLQRKCSGTRGNTCDGIFTETREKVSVQGTYYPCTDISLVSQDDETCSYQSGKINSLATVSDLLSTCKGSASTTSYGDSFEYKYRDKLLQIINGQLDLGIPVLFGNADAWHALITGANNICNKNGKRANYKNPSSPNHRFTGIAFSATGPFSCLSRCSLNARCDLPSDCVCASGQGSSSDAICDNIPFSELYQQGYVYVNKSGNLGICDDQCRFTDIDQNASACEHFTGSGRYNPSMRWNGYSTMKNGIPNYDNPGLYQKNCCGNDQYETFLTAQDNVPWKGVQACCKQDNYCVDSEGNCVQSYNYPDSSSCHKGYLCLNNAWTINSDFDKDGADDLCDLFPQDPCSISVEKDNCNSEACINSAFHALKCA